MWDKFKEFLADRFSEASTARGLTIFFGLVGWSIAPEHIDLIAQVVGAVLVFFHVVPDKKKTDAEKALEAEALQKAKEADAKKVLGITD